MEQMILRIPKMWADHHVLAVRQALQNLNGVQDITASAVRKLVRLSYDPRTIGQDQILKTLQDAGYDPALAIDFPAVLANKEHGSAWFVQGIRTTQTNRLDLEMSGDFRKY